MGTPPPRQDHLATLDGLRGIAALVVVVSHCANAGFLPKVLGQGLGQIGVTAFYTLSGFLMGYLYLSRPFTAETGRRYGVNRLARVLPLYYALVLAAMVAFYAAGLPAYDFESTAEVLRALLLVQGQSVLWSIPVEVQFYLVFAGIWALHARLPFAVIVGALLCAEIALWVLLEIAAPAFPKLTLVYWLHVFLVGVVFGHFHTRAPERTRALVHGRTGAVLAGVLLVLTPLVLPELRRRLGIPVLPNFLDPISAGYPILLLVLAVGGAAVTRWLAVPLLRFYGRISFGLYLVHLPVIEVLHRAGPGWLAKNAAGAALVLAISTLLALAAYHLIENPARLHFRERRSPRPAPGPA